MALDLVPHDAHLYFQFQDVARWVRSVDLLIAEVRTLRRVLSLESTDEIHSIAQNSTTSAH